MATTRPHYPYALANPRHRLAGYALDIGLSFVTLQIGWLVWSLVVWGNGQTPAKQILKMRVYSSDRNSPASWGHMAIRQYLLPVVPGAIVFIFIIFSELSLRALGNVYFISVIFSYLLLIGSYAVDAFWILKGDRRERLVDVIAHTAVLNESIRA